MTDLMDQRLAAAARRWQAEQTAPPAVPLDRLDEPLRRRRVRWRPLVAAAAAVLIVVGGASVVSRLGESGTTSPTNPTGPQTTIHVGRQHAQAVPWADLKAGHPRVRHQVGGQVVTPYDHVAATGHISGHLHPGDVLVFTAVLESPTDLPLDPCPDFNVAFGAHAWYMWRLNCAQVPHRTDQGRPILPAFKSVRFEMQVRVPDVTGRQKVLWTLDGPQEMPGFYGMVRVTPR